MRVPALLLLAGLLAGCAPPPPPALVCAGLDERREWPFLYPPGCANAYNLALMVEEPADLRRARPTGPALAAPLARAVRRHLDGADRLPPPQPVSPFLVPPAATPGG